MNFDASVYPYGSHREVVYGRRGMVCTSQTLAAQAGLDMLKKGGNAIDAALAAAMCLTVLEPTSNGLGSDAFALIWTKGKLYGINGSGWSPAGLTRDELLKRGYAQVPLRGWEPGRFACRLFGIHCCLSGEYNLSALIRYFFPSWPGAQSR